MKMIRNHKTLIQWDSRIQITPCFKTGPSNTHQWPLLPFKKRIGAIFEITYLEVFLSQKLARLQLLRSYLSQNDHSQCRNLCKTSVWLYLLKTSLKLCITLLFRLKLPMFVYKTPLGSRIVIKYHHLSYSIGNQLAAASGIYLGFIGFIILYRTKS